ncbi:uncharacterized protein HMPREF1541_00342 [Cyphellophora europaea CBS 101466]|uniref:Uncharacterized protein n=1 Tax=Cyphellophora europaea (strain CBS 101466) TaxID=1220924 RepID=W2SDP3_CYPE1|nr:uncharacterized protein HMPREF1541_00342 [Cyphellophora europaea CBS 101466]ETN46158.1 hypothetical protein HMPREF1541_00342 [Cyphellophora europaea CBS 101466]
MAGPRPSGTATITFTKPNGDVTVATIGGNDFDSVTGLASSMESIFTETTGGTTSPTGAATTTTTDSSESSAATTSSGAASTLITSTSQTASTAAEQTNGSSGVASGANGENPSETSNDSCTGISCNSGLQAAIAVPVVVVTLALIALLFFCIRRRRRRPDTPVSEKQKQAPKKKWSRHLRVFSFDAELLMGGRFSSSNSLRSGGTASQRSQTRSTHNATPSLHSVDEEVAPPYRDAVSQIQPPSTVPMASGMTSTTPDPFPRPDSTATAPPPYISPSPANGGRSLPVGATAGAATGAGVGALATGGLSRNASRASTQNIQTPVSTRSLNDPFRNDVMSPVSPIDNGPESSPFVDPPEAQDSPASPTASHPMMGRARDEQLFDDARSEVSSNVEVSSVREAQIGRSLSTRAGRVIDGRGSS